MSKEEEQKEKKEDLAKVRSIFLSGHVDEKASKEVIEKLIQFEKESPLEDVYLYIDSYGGYLDSMFAIIDTMNLVKCDVQTICVGKAMSAGAAILSSGAKGKRFVTPYAKTMVHQLWAWTMGSAHDVEIDAEDIKKDQKRLERLMARNTGQPLEKIKKDMRNIRYMNAEESVKYGLVDEIKGKIR
jgi:ATP-dependent Clp protease protease subunit